MKTIISLITCIALAVGLHAQNWPSFRGKQASGVADGQNPPAVWDAGKSLNIRWKTAIPGLAHSSPVVWGERVFVTSAVSSDPNSEFRHGLYGDVKPAGDVSRHSWRVYCLDKKTGKTLWEKTAREGIPKTKRHPKSSFSSATPAVDGKHVVAFFGSEGLYCYNFDGGLLWQQDLGVLDGGWFYDPDYQWGTASSPIIFKDLVIVQCDVQKDSFIAAFDIKNGKQVWRTSREELPSWGTPTVYEGKTRSELITNATKFVRGYDPATGKELWRLTPNPEITATTPIIAQDLIFIANGYAPIQPIYAIRPGGNGDISLKENQESSQSIAWSKKRGGPYMPTPLAYGDYLYVCGNSGILTCYKLQTGERVYQQRIGQGGAYSASPVAADGRIYFASEDGDVHVVKAGPEYQLIATNPVGEVCMATPAISEGMIILRGQHHVFGISESTASR
ncbi:MAG TPA: PQQ-binding-like beta-propeller repeat protein [Acidobacteriota bacterium]|jgi:outer membrane protein assembly factor BamB